MKIAMIVGSLRQDSYNRQLAQLIVNQPPEDTHISELPIANLPFYNQDLEKHMPAAITELKKTIREADGVLFVTPEYNRSIPGIVKNAIDWASRPDKESVWSGKPVGMMGASDGQFGTMTAQFDLRRILTHTGCLIMPQPQVYVSRAQDKLAHGNFDPTTTGIVSRYLQAFMEWIHKNSS